MKNKLIKGQNDEPSSRSTSSCAACKLLKRRCSPKCIFAPYFRADEPKKFAQVHKVFGASNVSKILSEVPEEHREDTVNSLSYEAEARLRDPVYGCIGAIAILQRRMVELQHDVALARARLARYAAFHHATTTSTCVTSPLGVPDFCSYSSSNNSTSSSNILGDHISVPMNQIESPQMSQTGAYNATHFGQVPLLPL